MGNYFTNKNIEIKFKKNIENIFKKNIIEKHNSETIYELFMNLKTCEEVYLYLLFILELLHDNKINLYTTLKKLNKCPKINSLNKLEKSAMYRLIQIYSDSAKNSSDEEILERTFENAKIEEVSKYVKLGKLNNETDIHIYNRNFCYCAVKNFDKVKRINSLNYCTKDDSQDI